MSTLSQKGSLVKGKKREGQQDDQRWGTASVGGVANWSRLYFQRDDGRGLS